MSDLIAIVGRPNVGKSALFNRIVGKRIAIVHDMPGVTRDRVTAEAEWNGRPFTLVDTGGIGLLRGENSTDVLTNAAISQVDLAIELAQVILFVVNVQEGLTALDHEVAARLRKASRPVILVVNKVDHHGVANDAIEFTRLGFPTVRSVSAIHGGGISDLMDAAIRKLPKRKAEPVPDAGDSEESSVAAPPTDPAAEEGQPDVTLPSPTAPLRLAIVGRPNVGKSSLVNALTRSERVIVSPIPGTTRDAIDVPFDVVTEGRVEKYILTDTAGIRKNKHAQDTVEFFSVQRSESAIEKCDIAVLVLDAADGITEQDKKIAGVIVENRKACIVVVNKWDLASDALAKAREKAEALKKAGNRENRKVLTTLGEFGEWVQERLFFIDYAPVIFTSAKEGFHLDRLLESVRYVADQLRQRVPTALLNRTLNDAVERRQPVSNAGHRLKFFYATQIKAAPPFFLLFVNRSELFSDSYSKYLAGELRKAFGYEGCPIILVPKARPKTIESVRRFKPAQKGGSNARGNTRQTGQGRRRPAPKSSQRRRRS